MPAFSVKKPLTVFVAVLAVIVLGVVAYLRMTPDLLPNMDFPYVIIVTADPGASPESVEADVTRPMEQSMATLERIKSVTSTSSDSVSMVVLEFEQGVNMDTVSVDIQQHITALQGQWPDTVATPYVLKINPSMLPVMVAAVSYEGRDVNEVSDFVEETLSGKLNGISGVASVEITGTVDRQMHVVLDQKKLDAVSGRVLAALNRTLDKASGELAGAKKQITDAQKALSDGLAAAGDGMGDSVAAALKKSRDALEGSAGTRPEIATWTDLIDTAAEEFNRLRTQMQDAYKTMQDTVDYINNDANVNELGDRLGAGVVQIVDAITLLTRTQVQLDAALAQVEEGLATVAESRKSLEKQTDVGSLLSINTLSALLTAQDFAMPAGYVRDDAGIRYMVSVGDKLASQQELEELLLIDLGMEGVEPIRLEDVAQVFVTDNSDEIYAKLNGVNGVIASFTKQSNFATAEVCDNIQARFTRLEADYEGLHFVPLMDQGTYIHLIVNTILSSLLWGALFSVAVLFLFLRDWRPTVITLVSIPISVVFAIVLMYFSGVTINMISLSGLAVAVGMLVDNSVVVIENIYRLRARGATVVQAAVSGAGQVLGAVTASTMTTVCVFLPIVFVEGITRQLFTDLALTMCFSLLASLLVALTLVPAMASGLLRRQHQSRPGLLDRIYPAYRRALTWSLNHKAAVLLLSLILLVTSSFGALKRGYAFMPDMDMNMLDVTVTMPEGCTMAEAAELADEVSRRALEVEHVETVGAMMSSGGSGMLSMGGGSGGAYDVTMYVTLPEGESGAAAGKAIEEACADMACQVKTSGAMAGMEYITGEGISVHIFGDDMEDLQAAARAVAARMGGAEGVGEVSDGLEDAAEALHISVDREKAMSHGMTVAQVYMQIAAALSDSVSGANVTVDQYRMELVIESAQESRVTVESLPELTIRPDSGSAMSGMSGGMSGMSGSFGAGGASGSGGLAAITEKKEDGDGSFPLGDIARVERTVSLNTIAHDQQRRYLAVSAGVAEGYNVTLVAGAVQRALSGVALPQGVTLDYAGENEQIMEAMEQLLLLLALGILLVYFVMVAQFQSLKSPFIVMFTIPLAFTGGFLALLIAGIEVSVVSMIGFVMLVGIIVNNGIVLVDYINQQRLAGMERREAILDAGVTRMRPILMTSLTTILGLIVMALARNAGTALMQPVALVCIGGLLYATLMTLFVVPCMYDMLNRRELRKVSEEELQLLDE